MILPKHCLSSFLEARNEPFQGAYTAHLPLQSLPGLVFPIFSTVWSPLTSVKKRTCSWFWLQRGRPGWRASPFPSLLGISGLLWPLELCSPTNPVWSNQTKLCWPTFDRQSSACALVYTCSIDYGNWSWTYYCWSPHCPTVLSNSCATTLPKHQKHQCLFTL